MRTLIVALLSLSLAGGVVTTAHADKRDHRRDHRYERHDDRGRHHRHGHDHRRHWTPRDAYHVGYIHGRQDQRRYDRSKYVKPPGYRKRAWRRGERLPPPYYARRYIVHDYHVYRLRPPPRGYHWVRVDGDVVLAAVASGLIVQVVNGLFD